MMSAKPFRHAPLFWEKRGLVSWLLWPASCAYGLIVRLKTLWNDLGFRRITPIPVPIIIVGNLRVGGTGKTPIVIALANQLSALGWKPGIISRGYGAPGQSKWSNNPAQKVLNSSDPTLVGDEPVHIANRTQDRFPIWVHPLRLKSINALLEHNPQVDVIISDDGLQHTKLPRWPAREGGRDIEIVVRDDRKEGNRFLLPAGPLRESAKRDRDATLYTHSGPLTHEEQNGYFQGRRLFTLTPTLGVAYQLKHPTNTRNLHEVGNTCPALDITAVAALGNPQRFFKDLKKYGIHPHCIGLPDHSTYTPEFFKTIVAQCILITEKDAVKCNGIDDERIWVVPMTLLLSDDLMDWLESILRRPDPYCKQPKEKN